MSKLGVLLVAALASTGAQAGIIDIGAVMGGANVYTVGDFRASGSDVEGAIVAGGNVTIDGYSVNATKHAVYAGHSVIAGGNISLTNGSINNGKIYTGGTATFTSAADVARSTVNPVDFAAASRQFKDMAAGLSLVAATGKIEREYSANKLIGSGKGGVDIFNVSAGFFDGGSEWKFAGLTQGQTLIFNISGANGGFNNGNIGWEPMKSYNVLFNFYEATTVDVKGIIGNVLAPYAAVKQGNGVVKGQVIADSWNSSVQVDWSNFFVPVDVAGFELIKHNPPVDEPSDVPEPGTLALMMAGLAGALVLRRRRA